jgi:hypothetical protein
MLLELTSFSLNRCRVVFRHHPVLSEKGLPMTKCPSCMILSGKSFGGGSACERYTESRRRVSPCVVVMGVSWGGRWRCKGDFEETDDETEAGWWEHQGEYGDGKAGRWTETLYSGGHWLGLSGR